MTHTHRFKLLGTYRTPKFRYGQTVTCAVRGKVKIVGLTDARIPWPKCRTGKRSRAIILYGDLAKAVRRESATAIAYWFGVGQDSVWRWRRALGIGRVNAGTSALLSRNAPDTCQSEAAMTKLQPALKSPERAEKIAASKRGKPRPASVRAALLAANIGRKASDETRAKMSAGRKGRIPPGIRGPVWTADELVLLGAMPDADVAKTVGRTLSAVQSKRYLMGIEAFRS